MTRAAKVGAAAAVLLVLGASGVMCQRVGERGRYTAAYSTFGAGPAGARALFELAERRGAGPVRWVEDFGRLPSGGGVLVALGGCEAPMRRDLSRFEVRAVLEWVESGGVLVVAGAHDFLTDEMGVTLYREALACDPSAGLIGMLDRAARRDGGTEELEDIPAALREDPAGTYDDLVEDDPLGAEKWASPQPGFLEGMPLVPMRRPAAIRVADGTTATSLLRVADADVGVVVTRGSGHIVAFSSASPFQNRDMARADGGVLFQRVVAEYARGGPVIFDEYHLGVGGTRSMMRYTRQLGGGALVLQLLLVIGLLLWRGGTRFGAPLRALPELPGGTVSYVDSVGSLYQKTADVEGVIGILGRHALSRIARHHHVPDAEPGRLARTLEERARFDAAGAVRELALLFDKASQKTQRDLVQSARRIDELVSTATRQGG